MHYSNSPLDRLDHLRSDKATIEGFWHAPQTCVLPLWQNQVLVQQRDHQPPDICYIRTEAVPNSARHPTFLGEQQITDQNSVSSRHWFGLELDGDREPDIEGLLENSGFDSSVCKYEEIRVIGPLLQESDGAIVIYARALANWQNNSGFCSRCGHKAQLANAGHMRVCSNDECATPVFPRTDPAVIMLVVDSNDADRCLLGRSPGWPDGVYSTLAGFVEAGESLEAAVAREVQEETGIQVNNIRYVASQPWPFPRSIMLGFSALASSTDINVNRDELEDARWFTRSEIATFGEWGIEQEGYKLPRRDSIARHLVDRWLEGKS